MWRGLNKTFGNIPTAAGVSLIILLTSCNLNRSFLKPEKLPRTLSDIKIKTPNDTLIVYFSGIDHQPSFTVKNGREAADPGFTIESVMFKSANGDTLNGWLLKPKDLIPTITLLHVHGNSSFLLHQYKAVSPLLKYGFQIFLFDYSGYGFSTGKATRKNILTDALSAVEYVKARPDVKGTKLVIYGQSLGGHLSAVVAEKKQNDIEGLVIEGAFSSYPDIAAHMIPVAGRLLVKRGYSAKRSIRKFHKPLLVIHSTEDKVIPFYMGKKIFENANSPKEFYEIKKCHICGPTYYPAEISEKIKVMLK